MSETALRGAVTGLGLAVAGCSALPHSPEPSGAMSPAQCGSSAPQEPPPIHAPPPPASASACVPKHPTPPELRAKPYVEVGETRIYLAPCTEPGRSPGVERAPEDPTCRATPHDAFEVCASSTVKQAVSPIAFLRAHPAEGEEVLVRGRLAVSGQRGPRGTASLGLIGFRDHFGTCLMVNLLPGPGAPADAWQCSAPPSEKDARLCCNERPSRPPTGLDLVVRARMKKALLGPRTEVHALADLAVESVCVLGGDQSR